jgi:hypothetical protein
MVRCRTPPFQKLQPTTGPAGGVVNDFLEDLRENVMGT